MVAMRVCIFLVRHCKITSPRCCTALCNLGSRIWSHCNYGSNYGIWQHSSTGSVPGVNGNCDLDYAYIDYAGVINKKQPVTRKNPDELAAEVLNGQWGNGADRYKRLTAAGYDYAVVQEKVNRLLNHKSDDQIACKVIRGSWGNGKERIIRLKQAGYDPIQIQKRVNQLL